MKSAAPVARKSGNNQFTLTPVSARSGRGLFDQRELTAGRFRRSEKKGNDMTTATKMNREAVLADVREMSLGSPSATANLASTDGSPLVASKGAGSVHVLRRRRGAGWQYLGYAVWSCRTQGWVRGSWDRPVSADEAHAHLADMAWEG